MPVAAVHDSQVPNRGGASGENVATSSAGALRPVFLDLENGLKLDQQPQVSQQQQQQQQIPTLINPASLFTINNQNVNPLLGQLIPLSLTHGSGATFGYIPALILNNGQVVQQQSPQGSQTSANVPLDQQQQTASPNNQQVIAHVSKK